MNNKFSGLGRINIYMALIIMCFYIPKLFLKSKYKVFNFQDALQIKFFRFIAFVNNNNSIKILSSTQHQQKAQMNTTNQSNNAKNIVQESFDRKNIQISPQYLLQIAKFVQNLNIFCKQENLQPLSGSYKNALTNSFKNLSQHISVFQNDPPMIQSAIIKCKMELEVFVLDKLAMLLSRQTKQIADIISHVVLGYKQNIQDHERVLILERKKKIDNFDQEKDKAINSLKKQVMIKREYCRDLQQRVKELQKQNSQIYEKIIQNAKNTINHTLASSPSKRNQTNTASNINKLKMQIDSSHKTLSLKQVQQTIYDIMHNKAKQENVKNKHMSLNMYLKTYFKFKFGMKGLAEETQVNFRDALIFFAKNQQKSLMILFQKIINQECQQSYFNDQKNLHDRLIKIIKRYINQKQKIPLDHLDKIYDTKIIDQKSDVLLNQTDVQYVLINIYRNMEVDSLQMIFNEIMSQKIEGNKDTLPSKKLINQILNYQLKKHMLKVEDIMRQIKKVDSTKKQFLTYEDLQNVIINLKIPQEKYELITKNFDEWKDKSFTYSQVVKIIQQMKKQKTNKKK